MCVSASSTETPLFLKSVLGGLARDKIDTEAPSNLLGIANNQALFRMMIIWEQTLGDVRLLIPFV